MSSLSRKICLLYWYNHDQNWVCKTSNAIFSFFSFQFFFSNKLFLSFFFTNKFFVEKLFCIKRYPPFSFSLRALNKSTPLNSLNSIQTKNLLRIIFIYFIIHFPTKNSSHKCSIRETWSNLPLELTFFTQNLFQFFGSFN